MTNELRIKQLNNLSAADLSCFIVMSSFGGTDMFVNLQLFNLRTVNGTKLQ